MKIWNVSVQKNMFYFKLMILPIISGYLIFPIMLNSFSLCNIYAVFEAKEKIAEIRINSVVFQ